MGSTTVLAIHGTGKFSLQCERVVGPTFGNPNHPNPTLDKLATGKLELEVKDAEEPPQKQGEEKEGFTAWGEEAGGLQAGLGFRPGEQRAYRIGENVMLVVRVRNVGKEPVRFQYLRQFFMETPPTVTDGEGKPVHFRYGVIDESKFHIPVDVNLVDRH